MPKYNYNNENSNSNTDRSKNNKNTKNHSKTGKNAFIEKYKKEKTHLKLIIKKSLKKIQTLTNNLNKETENVNNDWIKFKKVKTKKLGVGENKWNNNRKYKIEKNFHKMKNKKIKKIQSEIKEHNKLIEKYEKQIITNKKKFKEKLKIYNIFETLKKNNDEFEIMYDELRIIKDTIEDIETKRAFLDKKLLFDGKNLLDSSIEPYSDSYSKYRYANKVQKNLSKKLEKFLKKCS